MKVSRPLAGQKGYDIRPDVIDDRILILQSCVLADERMEDIPEQPLYTQAYIEKRRKREKRKRREGTRIFTNSDSNRSGCQYRPALTCAFRRGAMSQKRGNVTEGGPCHKRGHVTTHCPSHLVFLSTVAMYVYLKFLMFVCVPFRYVWCVCWYQRTQHRYTGLVKCVCVRVCVGKRQASAC